MATKKDSADKADEKKAKKTTTKKTTAKKITTPKAPGKKAAPEKAPVDEMKTAIKEASKERTKDLSEKFGVKPPAIIDDSDKILKSSDVELPADEPAGKQTIVVSHGKSAKADDSIEVINAEEVLKDLEYDFDSHEIKPFKGQAMTSHEMHQGKYGIIDDVTKKKKKKR